MARRQRDEPRVFVHLAHHVLRADDAEAARVEQAHLDAFFRQRHPRINIRRIIVVVNQDVVAPAEFQPGGDEAQRRARSGRRARFRPAGSSAIARRACARRPAGAARMPPGRRACFAAAQSAMASATRRGSGQTPACARKILSRATGNSCRRSSSLDRISVKRHARIKCKSGAQSGIKIRLVVEAG